MQFDESATFLCSFLNVFNSLACRLKPWENFADTRILSAMCQLQSSPWLVRSTPCERVSAKSPSWWAIFFHWGIDPSRTSRRLACQREKHRAWLVSSFVFENRVFSIKHSLLLSWEASSSGFIWELLMIQQKTVVVSLPGFSGGCFYNASALFPPYLPASEMFEGSRSKVSQTFVYACTNVFMFHLVNSQAQFQLNNVISIASNLEWICWISYTCLNKSIFFHPMPNLVHTTNTCQLRLQILSMRVDCCKRRCVCFWQSVHLGNKGIIIVCMHDLDRAIRAKLQVVKSTSHMHVVVNTLSGGR